MAKLKFPGKALKLNQRERVRAPQLGKTPEELKVINIKKGLKLFRSVFGDSEEDDFEGFECLSDTAGPSASGKTSVNGTDQPKRLNGSFKTSKTLSTSSKNGFKKELKPFATSISDDSIELSQPNHVNETKIFGKDQKRLSKDDLPKQKADGKFVLPAKSNRSSRIITPNKRLLFDVGTSVEAEKSKPCVSGPNINDQECSSSPDDSSTESNEVSKTIALYTNSITEEPIGFMACPKPCAKKSRENGFSLRDSSPKKDKVRMKIERLLRSPWDERLKNSIDQKTGKIETDSQVQTNTRNILRKPRLNLNHETLEKIRCPSSSQSLLNSLEEDSSDTKCSFCHSLNKKNLTVYNVSCCDFCNAFITDLSSEKSQSLDCLGSQGECQLVGLPSTDRCRACWLLKILLSCSIPPVVHDRLRNLLPSGVKEKVLTSLAQNILSKVNLYGTDATKCKTKKLNKTNAIVSVVDLPGGWKRKTGSEVVVISPSGQKFRSVETLEDYLKKQGVTADASILFGTVYSQPQTDISDRLSITLPISAHKNTKKRKVVVTNLPGGWQRRIKWKSTGKKCDTYVFSPDGRTFKSRKELQTYFQQIGKIDDMNKYFPLQDSGGSHTITSNENSEFSSIEPWSSSEESVSTKSEDSERSVTPQKGDLQTSMILSAFNHGSVESHINVNSDVASDETSIASGVIDLNSFTSEVAGDSSASQTSIKSAKKRRKIKITQESLKDYSDDVPKRIPISSDPSSVHYSPLCDWFFSSPKNEVNDFAGFNVSKSKVQLMINRQKKRMIKLKKKLIERNKPFTKEKLKNNWSRKIRWADNGEGKITNLTTPDGQRLKSSIELLAYFKKAGNTTFDMDYYFPKQLVREQIEANDSDLFEDSEQPTQDVNELQIISQQASIDSLKKVARKKLKMLKAAQRLSIKAGPRVKNVCRSQAQVLGMPRAIFSTKDKKGITNKKTLPMHRGRVLKKTQWCNRCSGCLTPNCRKCGHCLDMKKYGGPGTKKKPCIFRKCINPRLSFKSAAALTESSSNCDTSFQYSSEDIVGDDCKVSSHNSATSVWDDGFSFSKPVETEHDYNSWDSGEVRPKKNIVPLIPDHLKKNSSCAKVNIDYWQEKCNEPMSGFPIISTDWQQLVPLCFRCGSAGEEKLIYCSVCCEGFHPFCLDEFEMPQSEFEELFWVCQCCIACHACGNSDKQLNQCSACSKYYHLECIGPGDHSKCLEYQLPWELDVHNELIGSWPLQPPLWDTDPMDITEPTGIRLYEQLSRMTGFQKINPPGSDRKKPSSDLVFESVTIEDTLENLEEEEGVLICLDDVEEELEESLQDNNVEVHCNPDIWNPVPEKEYTSMINEEYLSLKYKYIPSVQHPEPIPTLKQSKKHFMIELAGALKYTTWHQMVEEDLVPNNFYRKTEKIGDAEMESNPMSKQDLKRFIAQRRNEMCERIKTEKENYVIEQRLMREQRKHKKFKFDPETFRQTQPQEPVLVIEESASMDESQTEVSFYEEGGDGEPQTWEEFDRLFEQPDKEKTPTPKKCQLKPMKSPGHRNRVEKLKKLDSKLSPNTKNLIKNAKIPNCLVKLEKIPRLKLNKKSNASNGTTPSRSEVPLAEIEGQESPKDPETPQDSSLTCSASTSLNSRTRRRTIGRASELASLRKSMLD